MESAPRRLRPELLPLELGLFVALFWADEAGLVPLSKTPFLFLVAWAGAWLLNFVVHVIMGTLSFWLEQSMKLMDVWFAGFLVFSGYLIPVELFPEWLRDVLEWLPFHGQIGVPVEVALGMHERSHALALVAVQWAWILGLGLLAGLLWRRGLRRFAAVGG